MTEPKPLADQPFTLVEQAWAKKVTPFFDAQLETEVFVCLWGAGVPAEGRESAHFEKRVAIQEYLIDDNAKNRVVMPEQLLKSDSRYAGYRMLEAEHIQATHADVIIALVPPVPEIVGVRAEVLASPEFEERMRLVRPDDIGPRFVDSGVAEYEGIVYDYPPDAYADCHEIRAWCLRQVERKRRLKHLQSQGIRR